MKTVLAVGMLDSVHFARWVKQFDPKEVNFILFPSTPHRKIHPLLKIYVAEARQRGHTARISPIAHFFSIPLWLLDQVFENRFRSSLLLRELRKAKVDYLHALEFQNAGYLAARTLTQMTNRPKFIATNWGSDIFWFRKDERHLKRIRQVLDIADFYSCECKRDVDLARELGYRKDVLPVFPNAGGFSEQELAKRLTKPAERDVILVKGYEGWAGQARMALEALARVERVWSSYRVVVFSANRATRIAAKRLSREKQVEIVVHKKKALKHGQMLDLFAQSRLYLGVSRTDGISTSLLEAMAMGSFPIQTSTSCAGEWQSVKTKNLLLIEGSVESIAASVQFALEMEDDLFQDENLRIIRDRALQSKISPLARSFYDLEPLGSGI